MSNDPAAQAGDRHQSTLPAWGVHLLSASGAVLALLALDAALADRPRDALLWLFAALAVDGIDGTLARAARVKQRLPRIDGEVLDLVIDYLTYVFIPALLIWRSDVLPEPARLPLAGAILVSSLYVFARRDMKSDDGYFRGFPALWNIVAFYFIIAPPLPLVAAAIILALIGLSFAPVHVVHPFRVRDFGIWLPAIAVAWALSTAALLLPEVDEMLQNALLVCSLATAAILVGMGLWRSARGDSPANVSAIDNRSQHR